MIVTTPGELLSLLGPGQRLLALDVGDKHIGLALSDETRTLATPLETLSRRKFKNDLQSFENIKNNSRVGGLVAGFPLNMDGTLGTRAQSVRDYAQALSERLQLPLLLWDERLSTNAVMRGMQEGNLRLSDRKARKDQLAAVYILQGVLQSSGIAS